MKKRIGDDARMQATRDGRRICPNCNGSAEHAGEVCGACGSRGIVAVCGSCHGSGEGTAGRWLVPYFRRLERDDCQTCAGNGYLAITTSGPSRQKET